MLVPLAKEVRLVVEVIICVPDAKEINPPDCVTSQGVELAVLPGWIVQVPDCETAGVPTIPTDPYNEATDRTL